jgi:signal peptidase I
VNFVNRLAYLFHEPRRGDVVAIRMPAGEHVMYMKRIVGLPGETVTFRKGYLYINGQPVEEQYLKLRGTWDHEPEQDRSDEYYFVGDNRDMPWDDHYKGRTTRHSIVGKLLL